MYDIRIAGDRKVIPILLDYVVKNVVIMRLQFLFFKRFDHIHGM